MEPNYSKLHVFGCLCYPWLRPYIANNLESCSKPCVLFDYSLSQSAYLCLDTSTSKIYSSRHVKFVESVLPFKEKCSIIIASPDNEISAWIPLVLPISKARPLVTPTVDINSSSPPQLNFPPSEQPPLNTSLAS